MADRDELGALRIWSDAAAKLVGKDPKKWTGYEFTGEMGAGMHVTGRVGKFGKTDSVFVPLEAVTV